MDLGWQVIKKAGNSRFACGKDIRLDNLGPIDLFSSFQLTTSSGKNLEDVSHAQIVSLMYKQITSNKGSVDLSFGFDRNCNRRQDELTDNKNVKGK